MKESLARVVLLALSPFLLAASAAAQFTPVDVGDATARNAAPDVAYDPVSDEFLVVFEVEPATGGREIWGQRVAAGGTVVPGSLAPVVPSVAGEVHDRPVVAYVPVAAQFVVGWIEDNLVVNATTVDAGTGAVGATLVLSELPLQPRFSIDVAGMRSGSLDVAILAWADSDGVKATRLHCTPAGLTKEPWEFVRPTDFFEGATDVSITSSGGANDNFLCVYRIASFSPDLHVQGRGLQAVGDLTPTGLGGVCCSTSYLFEAYGDGYATAVDGGSPDGSVLVTATVDGAGNEDVVARVVRFDGVGFDYSDPVLVADTLADERDSRVVWTGDTAVVTFVRDGDLHLREFDLVGAVPCGDEVLLATSAGSAAGNGGLASTWNGGADADDRRTLAVWDTTETGGAMDTDVVALRHDAPARPVDLGGGCDGGGAARAACTLGGNADFTPTLVGAPALAPTFLVSSLTAGPAACGACTLHPALDPTHFVLASATDVDGDASLVVPIPPGAAGTTVLVQWITALPASTGSCPLVGSQLALSNALSFAVLP